MSSEDAKGMTVGKALDYLKTNPKWWAGDDLEECAPNDATKNIFDFCFSELVEDLAQAIAQRYDNLSPDEPAVQKAAISAAFTLIGTKAQDSTNDEESAKWKALYKERWEVLISTVYKDEDDEASN